MQRKKIKPKIINWELKVESDYKLIVSETMQNSSQYRRKV